MSNVNVTLLRSVMDEILANPDKHNQQYWASSKTSDGGCETAYCFAGMACVLQGMEPDWSDALRMTHHYATYELAGGEAIDQTAKDVLGLDDRSADILFHEDNTVEELKHFVDILADEGTLRCTHTPHFVDDGMYNEDGYSTEFY